MNINQVVLLKCQNYNEQNINKIVGKCLDYANPQLSYGSKVLVKPNLLLSRMLACTHPLVTQAVCLWLLDNGHKPFVAESPGFGTAKKVAAFTGLDLLLKKINVPFHEMDNPQKIAINLPDSKKAFLKISSRAINADAVFSVAKIKAHSQMRITLSVKNCFGCVPGIRKAFVHTLYGNTHCQFANYIAGLWQALPPVTGICDGVIAMNETGPAKGKPIKLELIGASPSAPLLDLAIHKILNISIPESPLMQVLLKMDQKLSLNHASFPLLNPEDFLPNAFIAPGNLQPASFKPLRLAKSLVKRSWAAYFRKKPQ